MTSSWRRALLPLLSCAMTIAAATARADVSVPAASFASAWGTGRVTSPAAPPALLRVRTAGDGEPVLMRAEIPPVDLARKIVTVQFRLARFDVADGIEIRLSPTADFADHFAIEIPRYTVPDFNWLQPGKLQTLSFGLGNAKAVGKPQGTTVRYVAIYLHDNAKSPAELDFGALRIAEARHEGVLSYTFDDGWRSTALAARITAAAGQAGTAYIIPRAIGYEGYLSPAELRQVAEAGWGISAHHATPFPDMTAVQLTGEIGHIERFLEEHGYARSRRHLAYPEGRWNHAAVLPIVREAYDTARVAGGGMETLPPGDPWLMRTYNVMPTTTVAELRQAVRQAKANGQWLILMFHRIVDAPRDDYDYPIARFRELVRMVAEERIAVKPVHEVWSALQAGH